MLIDNYITVHVLEKIYISLQTCKALFETPCISEPESVNGDEAVSMAERILERRIEEIW
jgi:hypothetical protein